MSFAGKISRVFLLLVFPMQLAAQIPQAPKSLQSPNIGSLGSYGEIPVSLFTGKPDINVNLYTISDQGFQIPISLNYDAAGVRPDQHSGWVGLNWGLSTTYAVVRTIRDVPDDSPDIASSGYQRGWFNGNARNSLGLSSANWTSETSLEANAGKSAIYDSEPDEYHFSAPGFSGSFYLSHDGKWRVKCSKSVEIELINSIIHPPFTPPGFTGNPWYIEGPQSKYQPHVAGFVVIDEEGTRYEYGGSNAYCEYSLDFFDQGKGTWICNSWYLKSIKKQTRQILTFEYERGDFVAQMLFSVYNKSARVDGGWWFKCDNWSSLISERGPYNGKLISPLYLTKIKGATFQASFVSTVSNELPYTEDIFTRYKDYMIGKDQNMLFYLTYLFDCFYPVYTSQLDCDFNATLTTLLKKLKWRKLDAIQIKNAGGSIIKEFNLTYNNSDQTRLMLSRVQEKSGYDQSVLPPYEFAYSAPSGFTLPGYAKSHNDHWGFNNGKLMNLTDFDALADFGSIYRSAATDKRFYLTGSLASIKYPTGGMTRFWFEPHTYSKEVKLVRWQGLDTLTSNRTAGGLRIKEMHNYDAVTNKVQKKKFYYVSAFNPVAPDTSATALSSGVLGVKSQYYFPNYKPKPKEEGILVEEDIFSSQSIISGTENSLGSHIGYSKVVEWTSSEGWTVHKFTNFDNGYPDEQPSAYLQPSATPYIPFSDNAFKRGKELEVSRFHKNGNPVSRETYQYALIGTLNNAVRGVRADVFTLCQTNNVVYEATAYEIDVRRFLPYEVTTYIYDQNDPSKYSWQAAITGYKANGQVREIYTTDSKTLPVKVPLNSPPTNVYNRQHLTEFKYPDDYSDGVYPDMKLRNIIGLPVEVTTRLAVVNSGAFSYTPLDWKKVSYKTVDSTYVPEKVESKPGAVVTPTTDMEFLTYDSRGNVLTFREKTGGTTKLEYYGTGDIGKTDLLKSRTEAEGTTVSSTTSYDYKPLAGIQSITGPSGNVTWYNYDNFGRLSDIRENNSTGSLIKSFHYNYAGQGGWNSGIVDNPGVDSLSALSLISVAGCNFSMALSANPANPNAGQQVTLTATCTGGDCNNLTYSWTGQGANGNASTTTFSAPATPGSYTYSVSVARTGCSTPKIASLPLPVGSTGTGETCYVLAPASYPDRRLSNHNGILKVKAQDGTASQIWELSSQGSGFFRIVSKGGTNGTGIGSVLGVAGQGSAEGNLIELQSSTTGDHQLWEISAMTGSDLGRDKLVRKGTSLRIGSRFNWGAGSDNPDDPASDLALANDPNNDFGGNKWIKTSVGCPTGTCTPPAKPTISLAAGSGSTVCAATNQKVTLKTSGSGTIRWYKDGVLIAGAAGSTYEASATGSYTTTTTSTGTSVCTSTTSDAYVVLQTSGCTLSGDDRCIVTQVRLIWRDADHQRLKKATIQGSDDGVNWTTVHTFEANATVGWNVAQITNPRKFQHIRYAANPTDGVGDLKEIRFYHDDYILTGTGFGSEPNISGLGWENALDGNETTQWHAAYNTEGAHMGNTNFVGLTLPCATTCIKPTIYKTTAGNLVCPGSKSVTLIASGITGSVRWYKDGFLIPGQIEKTLVTSGAGAYKALSTNGSCTSGVSNEIVLQQDPGCAPSGDDRCIVTQVQLIWRDADHQRLKKATIQGSDDGVNWTTVHTFEANATVGWNIAQITNPRKFQHIRYAANPTDGVGDLKEIRFYHDDYILTGTGFGSEPNIPGHGWADALDGSEATQWHAAYNTEGAHLGNTNFVGLTLPCATTCIKPTIYKTTAGNLVCPGSKSATLIASGITGSVRWYKDGFLIPGQIEKTLVTSGAGAYKALSTNGSCTSGVSNEIVLQQDPGCAPSGDDRCIVTQVQLIWRDADHQRLKKATIQGSDDGVNWTTVHTFEANATVGWNIAQITNPRKFQHIRYAANPTDGVGDLKEIRFYHDDYILTGIGFGSEPNIPGHGWADALDGSEATQWHAAYNTQGAHLGNTNFVGLTLPCATTCVKPTIYKTDGSDVCAASSKTVTLIASGCTADVSWFRDGVSAGTGLTHTTSSPGTYTAKCSSGGRISDASPGFPVAQAATCGQAGNCIVNNVKLIFRKPGDCPECMSRLKGAKLQGSNDGGSTWTEIYTFSMDGTGEIQQFSFNNASYAAVRFVASSTGWGELTELGLYYETTKLTGTPFGTGNYALAFDNSDLTKWEGTSAGSSNYAGINLTGCGQPVEPVPSAPVIEKTQGTAACVVSDQKVTLSASGCTGTITWFRGTTQAGTGVTLNTNTPGDYSAKCTVGTKTSEASSAFTVAQASDCGTTTCVPPAKPTISLAGSNTTVCFSKSQSVTLTTNAGGTIQWYKEGVTIGGANGSSYVVTVAGNYSVTSTVNCKSPASDAFAVPQAGCAEGCNQTVSFTVLHATDARVSESTPQTNYGTISELALTSSTATGFTFGASTRAFLQSDELLNIPQGATIVSATLVLSGISEEGAIQSSGNSGFTGGILASFLVQRVTAPWQELTVNWANQPNTTSVNEVKFGPPTSQWNYDASIPVTQLIQDMVNLPRTSRFGLALKLETEIKPRSVVFSSMDGPSNKGPRIAITYKTCN